MTLLLLLRSNLIVQLESMGFEWQKTLTENFDLHVK